jgi:hypothetical protein
MTGVLVMHCGNIKSFLSAPSSTPQFQTGIPKICARPMYVGVCCLLHPKNNAMPHHVLCLSSRKSAKQHVRERLFFMDFKFNLAILHVNEAWRESLLSKS